MDRREEASIVVKKINEYQVALFRSLAPQLDKLPRRKAKIAETLYIFDKMSVNYRGGNIAQAMKYALSLFKYPEVLFYSIKRVLDSYKEHMFLKHNLLKYK